MGQDKAIPYPRRTRLGLIEASDRGPASSGRCPYPRRTRLGLIEARTCPPVVGRQPRHIPGGHAWASLKHFFWVWARATWDAPYPRRTRLGLIEAFCPHSVASAGSGAYPRRTRLGLIEASRRDQHGQPASYIPGGHAWASLKRLSAQEKLRARHHIPGGHAWASLKHLCARLVDQFCRHIPGGHAWASLKREEI